MCFYVQFIHSSIQYTENFIYRYIYRISYIDLSLLFTAILVWIFHTLSTKKSWENGTWGAEGLWGPGCLLLFAYGRPPDPWEDRPAPGWESLCCRSGGQCGWGSIRTGMKGVAQTPPQMWHGVMGMCSRPTFLGSGREGTGEGWAGPGCLGLSPSLPQPQACNTVWLQPWGWGVCP